MPRENPRRRRLCPHETANRSALRIEYAGLAALGAFCLYHLAIAILNGMAYRQLLERR